MNINISKRIQEIKNNGFTIIKNFLTDDDVRLAKKKIERIKESKNPGILWAPHSHDIFFLKLLCKKDLQNILIPLLNDPFYKTIPKNKPNYILGEYIAIKKQNKFLNLHIDSWIPSSSNKTWMVQVIFLLNNRNREDGCSIAIKKSHKTDKSADRKRKDYTYLEGKSGDAIIWDSRLWHGRCGAKKDLVNWTLIATLQSWFIKQRFDYTKSYNKKNLKKLKNVHKQLIGLCSVPPRSHKENLYIRRGYEVL
jgi:ectoine hydroxylase-related dioxygenase (phytanoyl-CoA dioxygenase family)